MTAQRQERYGLGRQIALIGPVLAVLIGLWAAFPAPAVLIPAALASTTERVVVNRYSGLAIEGFDPVAYFIQQQPVLGLPDYEAAEAGAVWRFHNEGNRASFVAHPDVYGPQFGGYDPVDVARGVTLAGNPRFFVVTGQRLYLFGIETHRDAFAAHPEHYLPEARERWPNLEETLAQ
jgi:hypothetical protein